MRLLGVSGQVIESDRCLYEPGGLLHSHRPCTRPGCGSRLGARSMGSVRSIWEWRGEVSRFARARTMEQSEDGEDASGMVRPASIHSTPRNGRTRQTTLSGTTSLLFEHSALSASNNCRLASLACKITQSSLARLLMSLAPVDLASPQEKSLTYRCQRALLLPELGTNTTLLDGGCLARLRERLHCSAPPTQNSRDHTHTMVYLATLPLHALAALNTSLAYYCCYKEDSSQLDEKALCGAFLQWDWVLCKARGLRQAGCAASLLPRGMMESHSFTAVQRTEGLVRPPRCSGQAGPGDALAAGPAAHAVAGDVLVAVCVKGGGAALVSHAAPLAALAEGGAAGGAVVACLCGV